MTRPTRSRRVGAAYSGSGTCDSVAGLPAAAPSATWALALADVTEPGRVALALAELRTAAAKNLGADAGTPVEWRIDGATPNPQAGRSEFAGQLPDGKFVREQVAVFAKGTRIYQATVLGEQLEGDSLDTFFTGLRIGS